LQCVAVCCRVLGLDSCLELEYIGLFCRRIGLFFAGKLVVTYTRALTLAHPLSLARASNRDSLLFVVSFAVSLRRAHWTC